MTCNRCMTDFKRMPFDELRQRVFEMRLKAASDAVAALSPSPAQQEEHNES